jgi:pre-mRNA processing factor 3 (PRP3)
MKRQGEGHESPNKRPKIDDIERLKAEIAKKLAAATSNSTDGLSEVQRKIQSARQEAQKRKAASIADDILQVEVEKVHDEQIKAKGGLNVAYHPALAMTIDPKARIKNRQAQFIPNMHATSLANQKMAASFAFQKPVLVKKKEIKLQEQFEDPTKSKYYDPNLQTSSGYQPKPRSSTRGFKFVEPGQYINLANEQRKQEQLASLKREIAEAARKAGMERELELVANAGIRVILNVLR